MSTVPEWALRANSSMDHFQHASFIAISTHEHIKSQIVQYTCVTLFFSVQEKKWDLI